MNSPVASAQPPSPVIHRTRGTLAILIVGILLGLFFALTGLMKLLDLPKLAEVYAKAGQPRWVFFGSGVVELLAGAAMVLPRFRTHAAWTLLAMIFLVSWRPWSEHDLFFLLPQVITIALLVFLVWLPSRPAASTSTARL
jgi:uncharacterized membrane protein YphA (DoxX/SURF4 family)